MMHPYENSLRAMIYVLEKFDEDFWSKNLKYHLKRWQEEQYTNVHLNIYGGAGSITDFCITKGNRHNISKLLEPWANMLLDCLTNICYNYATALSDGVSPGSLMGSQDFLKRRLEMYRDHLDDFYQNPVKALCKIVNTLHGSHCPQCNYTRVYTKNIEWYLAAEIVPQLIFGALESGDLTEVVKQVLSQNLPILDTYRSIVRNALEKSKIPILEVRPTQWSCEKCQHSESRSYELRFVVGYKIPGHSLLRKSLGLTEKDASIKKWAEENSSLQNSAANNVGQTLIRKALSMTEGRFVKAKDNR